MNTPLAWPDPEIEVRLLFVNFTVAMLWHHTAHPSLRTCPTGAQPDPESSC